MDSKEFVMEKATFLQCLFDVVLYTFILRLSFLLQKQSDKAATQKTQWIFFLSLIFCLFAFWGGDYFHLIADFERLKKGDLGNLESIYLFIASFSPSPLVFRLFIWGPVIYFGYKLTRKLSIYEISETATIMFTASCLVILSYARVSLSMMMIFYGATLFLLRNSKFELLSSVALIASSFYFHKSAAFGIGVVLSSLLLLLYKGKLLYFVPIFFIPTIVRLLENQIQVFVMADALEESSLNIYTAQTYFLDDFNSLSGLGITIQNFLTRMPLYVASYIFLKMLWRNDIYKIPNYIRFMGTTMFIIVVSTTLFFLFMNTNVYIIYYRLLNFAVVPMMVFNAFCFKRHFYPKLSAIVLYGSVLGCAYTLVYSTYNIL